MCIRDRIEDGVSGFLLDENNLDGMAETAVKLLTDDDLHHRTTVAGLQAVHTRFEAEQVVSRYEELYKSLCQIDV